ncbi:cell division protein FtsQ [Natranaerovirga hydrolytica]|uniref:Cell division protein FtsQ n=1 Tax=Natranaerovirga hydrolytica TaxID=680378 RepID=A0A4R1N4J8_9FIRM|nr:FtsQ-type POTRA domain-containing protein [Natranaerovirga hydrolytica]TCK97869.1 cell division protein FtsQ [Natranaerovirga hydrolytica]
MRKVQRQNEDIIVLDHAKNNKNKRKKFFLILFLLFFIIVFFIFNKLFQLNNIYIKGNDYYSEQEIMELIEGNLLNNTILYYLSFNNEALQNHPLIEAVNVQIRSNNEIEIEVFEKKVMGCIELMGMYLYFDREGIIVENLDHRLKNIPIVYGLNYDYVLAYEHMPVEDEEVFNELLEMIQLLNKYSIDIEEILINTNKEFTLIKKDIRILMGTSINIQEKINELNNILPSLEGKKGELNLNHIDHRIYFRKDV